MPHRRKDSDVWWISYTNASGKRVRRSTGTTDHKEAEAIEAKCKLEAHREKEWDEQPSRTFEQLMVPYLKATEDKRSHERDLCSAEQLRGYFAGRELGKLTAKDIRSYIERRRQGGVGPGTINREVGFLSAALNYARREWDWDIPNPAQGRRLREPEGRVRWLERAEVEALIAAAESQPQAPHLADFIRLALNTGCRRGELLGLEWNRVDLKANLIHLAGTHTKSGKRRSVPLNATAQEAIRQRAAFRAKFCPDSPWVLVRKNGKRIQSLKTSFGYACRKAGIEDFRIHDLRHTCAAWLVTNGVALPEVRDLLGHSTVRMTERYAHLAPENIRAAVARLDAMASRSGHVEVEKQGEDIGNTLKGMVRGAGIEPATPAV